MTSKLTPKLRFPAFNGAGAWEKIPLGHVMTEHGLKSDGTSEVHSVSVKKGVINQKEHLGRSFAAADTSNYNLAKPFDIIYTKSPTGDFPFGIVKSNRTPSSVIVSPLYGVFSPINNAVGVLIEAYFESPNRTKVVLESLIQKGAKNTIQISNKKFLSAEIYLPKLVEEQSKIANILLSLNILIAEENQRIEELRKHKQGLMQKLFPKVGQRTPELRFRDFIGEEWEDRTAGDLFSNRIESGEDDLPIYSVTMNDGMVKRSELDRKIENIAESSGNKKVIKGDVVYNMMRMWQGAFGVAPEDCMVSPAYVVLIPKPGAHSNFFGYLFKHPFYLSLLTSHSQGLTLDRLRLYYKDFARISVLVPSFFEQVRIASCLSSIDALILTQDDKINELERLKQGLMQGMFPRIKESSP
ncbi:restriction endonuclease subunit S [Deinococcus ficus]|uniref:restriction endonuclease subunit S n=1 Tax=Deinococcus ficus TaxID=317577 RepID=UPI000406392D|nr:restriction endonuclease subunit S [Deinococcus ficus]